ncbi:MAG TPA: NfeD family protein [Gaiellaceae bacterium]|nr:NfeD family protein [Gaiellaceae bacterium]
MIFFFSLLLAVFVLEEPWNWIAVGVGIMLEIGETLFFFWWSKRKKATVGAETLVGRKAVVSLDCRPDGQVKVAGEIWQARCDAGAAVGDDVLVRELDGLTLVVEPA